MNIKIKIYCWIAFAFASMGLMAQTPNCPTQDKVSTRYIQERLPDGSYGAPVAPLPSNNQPALYNLFEPGGNHLPYHPCRNTFDWTRVVIPASDIDFPTAPYNMFNNSSMISPFYDHTSTSLGYLARDENSDFRPEDGWELIHRGFGRFMDGSKSNEYGPNGLPLNPEAGYPKLRRSEPATLPYIILYNKYTGMLHVLGCSNTQRAYIVVKLEYINLATSYGIAPGQLLGNNVSGLLSGNSSVINALDKTTTSQSVSVYASGSETGNPFSWFHAAFRMGYDPCVVRSKLGFSVSFQSVSSGSADLVGRWDDDNATPQENIVQPTTGNAFSPDYLAAYQTDCSRTSTDAMLMTKNMQEEMERMEDRSRAAGDISAADAFEFLALLTEVAVLVAAPEAAAVEGAALEAHGIETKGALEIVGKFFSILGFAAKLSEAETEVVTPAMRGSVRLKGCVNLNTQATVAQLAVPGSYESNLLTEYGMNSSGRTVPKYPFYNQVLGNFALLKTPKVKYIPFISNEDGPTDVHLSMRFKLDEPISYAFNPAPGVNMEKSKISAALVISGKDLTNNEGHVWQARPSFVRRITSGFDQPMSFVRYITNPTEVIESYIDNNGVRHYEDYANSNMFADCELRPYPLQGYKCESFSTPFMPVECLQDFWAGQIWSKTPVQGNLEQSNLFNPSFNNTMEVYLRLNIMYVFSDKDGNTIRVHNEILTYRVDLIPDKTPFVGFDNYGMPTFASVLGKKYEEHLDIHNQTFGPGYHLVYAWNDIDISGILTLDPSARVDIVAGEAVNVLPGAVVPPNVTIYIQESPFACQSEILPRTAQQVCDYCATANSGYSANSCSNCLVAPAPPTPQDSSIVATPYSKDLTAAPNPFNEGGVRIDFGLEQAGRCMVTVHDALGKQVAVLLSTDTAAEGPQQLFWDAASAPVGIYFVTLHTEQGRQSIKVSKQ